MTTLSIAVESFFDPVRIAEVWPESIVNNKILAQQIEQRKELKKRLEDVVSSLPRPDMPLEEAINQGHVTEKQIAELYASLSELLESGRDYRRLVFYLPFEFLPKAPERFKQAYLKAWDSLLSVHDVRANFVDGDILEEEQQTGSLPRVVKAAHLIPKLVEHGLIEVKSILTLMEESDDQILRNSIADTLPVLADLGFLDAKEIRPRAKLIKPEPKVITEKRKAWLEWKKQKAMQPRQPSIIGARHLAGPFSENLKLMKEEITEIEEMVASIGSNLELSKLIYPAVLVFGSRLNGYGAQNADIDLAVFIRPGTSFDDRTRLKKLLKETFAHENIRADEIIEFWLEEKEGLLKIRDFTEWNVSLGESCWTHILFGAAWLGDKNTLRELFEKLLTCYMDDTAARGLYIEDMEQATLQYRLMHKGYERFFPPCGGIKTKHATEIDGESMFWDSGYRQLATRLFISRVFLPKLPIQ